MNKVIIKNSNKKQANFGWISNWDNLSLSQKFSLLILVFVLFALPLGIVLVIKPKIPITTPAEQPITPPGKLKQKDKRTKSRFKKSLKFDGASSYLVLPYDESLEPDLGYTYEMWIKPNISIYSSKQLLNITDDSSTTSLFGLLNWSYRNPDGNLSLGYQVFVSDRGNNCASPRVLYNQTISPDQEKQVTMWRHVALVIQPTGHLELYVDGKRKASIKTEGPCTSRQPLYVGSLVYPQRIYATFDGQVDEIRISDVARYGNDFSPSGTPFRNDKNTVVLLHLDGNTKDSSRYNNHAQVFGNVEYVDSNLSW